MWHRNRASLCTHSWSDSRWDELLRPHGAGCSRLGVAPVSILVRSVPGLCWMEMFPCGSEGRSVGGGADAGTGSPPRVVDFEHLHHTRIPWQRCDVDPRTLGYKALESCTHAPARRPIFEPPYIRPHARFGSVGLYARDDFPAAGTMQLRSEGGPIYESVPMRNFVGCCRVTIETPRGLHRRAKRDDLRAGGRQASLFWGMGS